jgi:hypothetical protein
MGKAHHKILTRLRKARESASEAKAIALEEGVALAPALAWLEDVLTGAIVEIAKDLEAQIREENPGLGPAATLQSDLENLGPAVQ